MDRVRYVNSEGIVDYEDKVHFANWANERANHFEFDMNSESLSLHITNENRWRWNRTWTNCASDMRLVRFLELSKGQTVGEFEHAVFTDLEYCDFLIEDSVIGLTSFYNLVDEYIDTFYTVKKPLFKQEELVRIK